MASLKDLMDFRIRLEQIAIKRCILCNEFKKWIEIMTRLLPWPFHQRTSRVSSTSLSRSTAPRRASLRARSKHLRKRNSIRSRPPRMLSRKRFKTYKYQQSSKLNKPRQLSWMARWQRSSLLKAKLLDHTAPIVLTIKSSSREESSFSSTAWRRRSRAKVWQPKSLTAPRRKESCPSTWVMAAVKVLTFLQIPREAQVISTTITLWIAGLNLETMRKVS